MIKIITRKDNDMKKQIEFLLGKKVSLSNSEINSLAHLTTGNLWVVKVLDKLGLSIDDIIYEEDRKTLRDEIALSSKSEL